MPVNNLSKDTVEVIKHLKVLIASHSNQQVLLERIIKLLEDIKTDTQKIKQLEQEKEPVGAIWYDKPTVTSTPYEKQFNISPLFSCSFSNSGPDSVYAQINDRYQFTLNSGSSYTLDFGYPKIKKIHLFCSAGETATVDIKGTY